MEEVEVGRPEDHQGLVPKLFGYEYGERRQDLRYPAIAGGFQIHHPVINQPAVRPKRSVVDILQFTGDDHDDIIEWLEAWNRSAIAISWGLNEEKVMLPLYLKGRASQNYRHLQPQVRENVELLKRELEGHFNSPAQRLHAKNHLGERFKNQMRLWPISTRKFVDYHTGVSAIDRSNSNKKNRWKSLSKA